MLNVLVIHNLTGSKAVYTSSGDTRPATIQGNVHINMKIVTFRQKQLFGSMIFKASLLNQSYSNFEHKSHFTVLFVMYDNVDNI